MQLLLTENTQDPSAQDVFQPQPKCAKNGTVERKTSVKNKQLRMKGKPTYNTGKVKKAKVGFQSTEKNIAGKWDLHANQLSAPGRLQQLCIKTLEAERINI